MSQGLEDITRKINQNSIQKIDLSRQKIGLTGITRLSQALINNKSVTYLNLNANGLNLESLDILVNSINGRNIIFESINLSDNPAITKDQDLRGIRVIVKLLTHTKELNLANTQLYCRDIILLFKELENNKILTNLNLRYNQSLLKDIEKEPIEKIATFFEKNNILNELDLSSNNLCGRHIERLFRGLKNNKGLLSLNLSGNDFVPTGITFLANILRDNKTITELNIGKQYFRDNIDSRCVDDIIDIIKNNHALTTLIINNHDISSDKIIEIARAVEYNMTLTTFDLTRENISKKEEKILNMIEVFMRRNKSLALRHKDTNYRHGYVEGYQNAKINVKKQIFCETLYNQLTTRLTGILQFSLKDQEVIVEIIPQQKTDNPFKKLLGKFLNWSAHHAVINELSKQIDNLHKEANILEISPSRLINVKNFLEVSSVTPEISTEILNIIEEIYRLYMHSIDRISIKSQSISRFAKQMSVQIISYTCNYKNIDNSGENLRSILLEGITKGQSIATQEKLITEYGESISFHDLLKLKDELNVDNNKYNQIKKPNIEIININPNNNNFERAQQICYPIIRGLKFQEVPGDGHCLFHAVALYTGQDQASLRRRVADYLEQNINDFRAFIQLLEGQTLENYIQAIRDGKEWADHVEIEVLIRALDRPIVVIGPNGTVRNRNVLERKLKGEFIFVYYNGHNHYDAFLREKNIADQDIIKYLEQIRGVARLHTTPLNYFANTAVMGISFFAAPIIKYNISNRLLQNTIFNNVTCAVTSDVTTIAANGVLTGALGVFWVQQDFSDSFYNGLKSAFTSIIIYELIRLGKYMAQDLGLINSYRNR